MPATQKVPTKPRAKPRARASEQARYEENGRVIRGITESLDVAQADLGKLRGSLGTGASDLRRDLGTLLRDARRDVIKIGKATRKDLERLQSDMLATTKPKPAGARAAKPSGARARKRPAAKTPRASKAAH
jgi:hypothetical protein